MRVDILTKAEANNIKNAIRSEETKIIWTIGITTGLRISDILNLKVGQIQQEKTVITEQKTGKKRRIYIRKPIRLWAKTKIKNGKKPQEKAFKLTREQVWKNIKHATEIAGISKNIGTHSMRKTYAAYYAKKHTLLELQERLNHSKLADTIGYTISNDKIKKKGKKSDESDNNNRKCNANI